MTWKMKHAASFQISLKDFWLHHLWADHITPHIHVNAFSLFYTIPSNSALVNTGRISGSTKTSLLRFCLFLSGFSQDEVSDNISRRTQKVKQLNLFYYYCCTVLQVIGLISSTKFHKAFQNYCQEFYTSILAHPFSVQNADISNFVLQKS